MPRHPQPGRTVSQGRGWTGTHRFILIDSRPPLLISHAFRIPTLAGVVIRLREATSGWPAQCSLRSGEEPRRRRFEFRMQSTQQPPRLVLHLRPSGPSGGALPAAPPHLLYSFPRAPAQVPDLLAPRLLTAQSHNEDAERGEQPPPRLAPPGQCQEEEPVPAAPHPLAAQAVIITSSLFLLRSLAKKPENSNSRCRGRLSYKTLRWGAPRLATTPKKAPVLLLALGEQAAATPSRRAASGRARRDSRCDPAQVAPPGLRDHRAQPSCPPPFIHSQSGRRSHLGLGEGGCKSLAAAPVSPQLPPGAGRADPRPPVLSGCVPPSGATPEISHLRLTPLLAGSCTPGAQGPSDPGQGRHAAAQRRAQRRIP